MLPLWYIGFGLTARTRAASAIRSASWAFDRAAWRLCRALMAGTTIDLRPLHERHVEPLHDAAERLSGRVSGCGCTADDALDCNSDPGNYMGPCACECHALLGKGLPPEPAVSRWGRPTRADAASDADEIAARGARFAPVTRESLRASEEHAEGVVLP